MFPSANNKVLLLNNIFVNAGTYTYGIPDDPLPNQVLVEAVDSSSGITVNLRLPTPKNPTTLFVGVVPKVGTLFSNTTTFFRVNLIDSFTTVTTIGNMACALLVFDGRNWRSLSGSNTNISSLSNYSGWGGVNVGVDNTISGNTTNSVALGVSCRSSNLSALAVGFSCNADGQQSVAIGNSTTANNSGAVAIGRSCSASGSYSAAIGSNSGSGGSQASSTGATALGGSNASGSDSFAAAIATNSGSYGATGSSGIAIGTTARAGNNAAAIGYTATATGSSSLALGNTTTASGTNSAAIGSNSTATAPGSFALGANSSVPTQIYKQVYASGAFGGGAGDAQYGLSVFRGATSNATPTDLTANGTAAGSSNILVLPNDSTFAFSILITARRTDADNESAGYKLEGVIDRNANAGTTALVGTVTKTVLAEDNAAWDVDAIADTTNGGLVVRVTGEAAKTIRWVAICTTAEVTG